MPLKSIDSESVKEEESSYCTRFPSNIRQRKVAKQKDDKIAPCSSSTRKTNTEDKDFETEAMSNMDVIGFKVLGVAATALVSPFAALVLADFLLWQTVLCDQDPWNVGDAKKIKKE